MNLRPPVAESSQGNAPSGKRRSEYKKETTKTEGLPPRNRSKPDEKKSSNYGSFLQGFGGNENK